MAVGMVQDGEEAEREELLMVVRVGEVRMGKVANAAA